MSKKQPEERSMEKKRLFIYLLLSFGLTWAIFIPFIISGFKWDGSNPEMEQFIALGMLCPFLAHILTRWITKEGFALSGKDSLMLGISLKDKKWKYYLLAILLPWIYFEAGYLLTMVLIPEAFSADNLELYAIDTKMVILLPLAGIISGTIGSFAALGEEGGWRGYMMPKLRKFMGAVPATIVGGIIWGLWHAPITCVGHNFGTDYPGFPYLGVVVMCVYCIFTGIILTFLTEKTNSVWPATFLHGVNNANPSILRVYMNDEVATKTLPHPLLGWLIIIAPVAVITVICLVIMHKNEKSGK